MLAAVNRWQGKATTATSALKPRPPRFRRSRTATNRRAERRRLALTGRKPNKISDGISLFGGYSEITSLLADISRQENAVCYAPTAWGARQIYNIEMTLWR